MANYNIQMEYYNGNSYDILYPQVNLTNITGNLPLHNTTGVLATTNGGTGSTTVNGAVRNLIAGLAELTSVNIAGEDCLPIQDVSANDGKKVRLNTLLAFINDNSSGLKISTIVNSTSMNLSYDSHVAINVNLRNLSNYVFLICTGTCKNSALNYYGVLSDRAISSSSDLENNEQVYVKNKYTLMLTNITNASRNTYVHIENFIGDGMSYISASPDNNLYLYNKCNDDDIITSFTMHGVSL